MLQVEVNLMVHVWVERSGLFQISEGLFVFSDLEVDEPTEEEGFVSRDHAKGVALDARIQQLEAFRILLVAQEVEVPLWDFINSEALSRGQIALFDRVLRLNG